MVPRVILSRLASFFVVLLFAFGRTRRRARRFLVLLVVFFMVMRVFAMMMTMLSQMKSVEKMQGILNSMLSTEMKDAN